MIHNGSIMDHDPYFSVSGPCGPTDLLLHGVWFHGLEAMVS
jgi:hypothetical protein